MGYRDEFGHGRAAEALGPGQDRGTVPAGFQGCVGVVLRDVVMGWTWSC